MAAFGDQAGVGRTSASVKVFGRRLAYENRPSTNPGAAWAGLWGFPVLRVGADGIAGVAIGSSAAWRERFFVGRRVDRRIGAGDSQCLRPDSGEGRAPRG